MKKIIIFAFISLIAELNTSSFAQNSNNNNLKTIIVKVKGITCAMDIRHITENLGKLNGVKSNEIVSQGTTTKIKIVYDPAIVDEQTIYATINNTTTCEHPDEKRFKVVGNKK